MMIDDEGFTEDKDYMKWVIEKAAESYPRSLVLSSNCGILLAL